MTRETFEPPTEHTQHLSPWDGISIIVSIVVGTSIFKSTALIFGNVAGPWSLLGVWVAGGLLSFIGALCYAELATTYPFMLPAGVPPERLRARIEITALQPR